MPSEGGEERRRLAAVLFADVHAYTALMARDEAGTFKRVLAARELCQDLIRDYRGEIIQTPGDAIFALFATAEEAVSFALAFQRDMDDRTLWEGVRQPLRFRIGIHWGAINWNGRDVFGTTINIAARLQQLAKPGSICVSDAVRHWLADASELSWRPLGWQNLHNVQEKLLVHELMPPSQGSSIAVVEREAPAEPVVGEASIAILPLVPLSCEPTDQHLAHALTSELIHNLTRFRDLLVIAHHSSLQLGAVLDDRAISRRLGARYLVRGTLLRSDRRVAITCQMIEAETGVSLFSEQFQGVIDDLMAFQEEAGSYIAGRFAVQIAAYERQRHLVPTLSAYGLVLRGEQLNLELRPETVRHARRLLEQAAALDPRYGRSYAGLSRTFNYEWRYAWAPEPQAALDRALELALKAVEHDALDARGYGELGYAHLYRKSHDSALAAYDRAMELNPNCADLLAEHADALAYSGSPERAVAMMERAMRLNPCYPDWYLWNLADAHSILGEHEAVIRTIHKMKDPSEGRRLLAVSYAYLGAMDDAKRQAHEILRRTPDFSISRWADRPPYRTRETLEYYVEGLRMAGLPA